VRITLDAANGTLLCTRHNAHQCSASEVLRDLDRSADPAYQRVVNVESEYQQVVESNFWVGLIHTTLTDAWHMVNDDGFVTAMELRLRFCPNSGRYWLIRLEASGSLINVEELEVIREAP